MLMTVNRFLSLRNRTNVEALSKGDVVVCRVSSIICIVGATFGVHVSLQGCKYCIVPHRTHARKMVSYPRLCSLFPLGTFGPQSSAARISKTGVRTSPNTASNQEPQKRPLPPACAPVRSAGCSVLLHNMYWQRPVF